jgi:peptidoglycan/LPS O-acetylase OafA/YrhL
LYSTPVVDDQTLTRVSRLSISNDVHLRFLDGMRGFAAGYVVLHHAMLNLPVGDDGTLEHLLRKLTAYGHHAVDIFIVLSGYCLMLPLIRQGLDRVDFKQFIVRRALRIVPAYYLALAFTLALIGTVIGQDTGTSWDIALPVTSEDVALHGLLIHQWFPGGAFKINHPHWSIGVEWQIYFFFPVLLMLRARYGPKAVAVGALVFGYAVWIALTAAEVGNPSPWGSSPYYLGLFAFGMLAAEVAESKAARTIAAIAWTRRAFFGLALASAAATALKLPSGKSVPMQCISAVVGAWSASMLVLLRIDGLPLLNRVVSSKPAVALGKMGYSIYLLHAPLLQIVYQYGVKRLVTADALRAPVMLAGCAALTLLVAIPFHAVAEKPFHRLSRRAFSGA